MKNFYFYLFSFLCIFNLQAENTTKLASIERWVESIDADNIGGVEPNLAIKKVKKGLYKLTYTYELDRDMQQNDVQIVLRPNFTPTFNWAPHLTPEDDFVIDQHVFRNPAMIVQDNSKSLTLLMDIENDFSNSGYRIYMDMNAIDNELILGMSQTHVHGHTLYKKKEGAIFKKGKKMISFYLMVSENDNHVLNNPFRDVLSFLWDAEGHEYYKQARSSDLIKYERFSEHTYDWAFKNWDAVWQEFEYGGKQVGAPAFVIDITQSPNYKGEANIWEPLSVWNQAWFSSLRSASGLYRYATRHNNPELKRRALMTKELALATPMKDDLFYGVASTDMENKEIDGKSYYRSNGWETLGWGNSSRNPITWDLKKAPFHILDMSWTALMMLDWYEDLEKDERLIKYITTYANKLLTLQDEKGYFPAWLDINTLEVLPYLEQSPETALSVWFLLRLHKQTGVEKYKTAALRAMDILSKEIIPTGRWEDFETYWSCSRYHNEKAGLKIERNNMYKQCNFSMYWTAAALLETYKITKDKKYLTLGRRTLDEMLMTQASWQPDYIFVNAVGGFGVMNADAEWNDSRGCLFADLILNYGDALNNKEYIERGVMALKSTFTMMYCPENPKTKVLWEKRWPFFGEEDYGFMMENYGHGGRISSEGDGIGSFTIYDWGNGAISESYNRLIDKRGAKFLQKH